MSTKDEKHFDIPSLDNNQLKIYDSWEQYGLKKDLLRGIYNVGFNNPSPIQKMAVMPIINKQDIRAQAQSGTGKTGAFSVGALQRINEKENSTQALVIVSTREIAIQNGEIIKKLGSCMDAKVSVVVGGQNISQSIEELKQKPHIIVGTPGRIIHMIRENIIDTSTIELFVVDEADEMLKMGFVDQVKQIFCSLPSGKIQTAMFSATWTSAELDISKNVLKEDHVVIDLRKEEQTLKGIEQYFVNLGPKPITNQQDLYKIEFLNQIFSANEVGQCVIFANTKFKAMRVHEMMNSKGLNCSVMHSGLTQQERNQVMSDFRNGTCRTLIATEIVGRGIDINQLSLVFNFDLPREDDKSAYIHRIGRAGRYGKKGKAINMVFESEISLIKDLEQYYSTVIEELPEGLDYR